MRTVNGPYLLSSESWASGILKSLFIFRKDGNWYSGRAMLWGLGYLTWPPVALGCLVRTNLHFEPFSLSAKYGSPEAIAALKFYDTCDRFNVCMIGIL